MTLLQALLLGLIQGATEFIPISSSGHLTLVPWLLNWSFDPDLKFAFDVLAHWGTLIAVLAVFWSDLWALARGWLRTVGIVAPRDAADPPIAGAGSLSAGEAGIPADEGTGLAPAQKAELYNRPYAIDGRAFLARIQADPDGHLAWLILIGSIPAAVLGLLFEDFFEMLFGTPVLVSALLLVTSALLAFSEWRGKQGRDLPALTWLDAIAIGLGQATAIAPGISRSGATMAAGLIRGVRRDAAARFSFLLSTPVIVGAGVWQLKDLLADGGWTAHLLPLLIGFVAAGVSGYLCIRFLLSYLRRGKLYPFAIYCALAGASCLIVAWAR
jgi:undecaprenyl-diphosphatase